MKLQTREEKLRDLFQVVQNNLFLLSEIVSTLQQGVDAAVKILSEKEKTA